MTPSGRWQTVLLDALAESELVGVQAAVTAHLGRAPTRSEVTAARRAAGRLVTIGQAQSTQAAIPSRLAPGGRAGAPLLVLVRPKTNLRALPPTALIAAATRVPDAKSAEEHLDSLAAELLRATLGNLTLAAQASQPIQVDRLDKQAAADAVTAMRPALETLRRLERQLAQLAAKAS